jgi:hypothetical protein
MSHFQSWTQTNAAQHSTIFIESRYEQIEQRMDVFTITLGRQCFPEL